MTKINKVFHPKPLSILRQKAIPILPSQCRIMFQRMWRYTMNDREHAVGFAANQLTVLGEHGKLNAFIAVIDDKWTFFGNAELGSWNKYFNKNKYDIEGCLSIPDKFYRVKRKKKIDVTYLDKYGREQTGSFYDQEARIIQHEMDHLNGILIADIGKEIINKGDNNG